MTAEEIEALGLREEGSGSEIYDVTIRCHVSELAESDDYIQAEVGDGLILKSIIVAMVRVMPELPDGWTWGNEAVYAGDAHHLNSMSRAVIDAKGNLSCWHYGSEDIEGHAPMPSAVAKALIEVWARTQAEAAR